MIIYSVKTVIIDKEVNTSFFVAFAVILLCIRTGNQLDFS